MFYYLLNLSINLITIHNETNIIETKTSCRMKYENYTLLLRLSEINNIFINCVLLKLNKIEKNNLQYTFPLGYQS